MFIFRINAFSIEYNNYKLISLCTILGRFNYLIDK